MFRRFLAIAALALTAAAPPPPAVLAPYISGGRFDPGDYGWMRGRFADATARQKADMQAVDDWLHQCQAASRAETLADLTAAGAPVPVSTTFPFRDPVCAAVSLAPQPASGTTWARFERALPRARAIADAYLFAVAMAGKADASELRAQLVLRPTGDQMLRRAWFWGQGDAASAPPLDPVEQSIVVARIGMATADADHANTEWLKRIVAKDGWPSVSKVGTSASGSAWLLVQHADADPAFQYRVLKLMAPLEAAHDLPRHNYAYLYDRVMLKLAGRQRYATQMTCAGGKRTPLPLEDAAAVGRWRQQAGLEPLAAYTAEMDDLYGPCPPDVIPPSPATR